MDDWKDKISNAWESFKSWGKKTAKSAMDALGFNGPHLTISNTVEREQPQAPSDKELIDAMARQDAERYTELQGQYMHELLGKISARRAEYSQNGGEDPDLYATRLCGLGNEKPESYCLAIQTQAMRMAENAAQSDTLSPIREKMGWTCQYAAETWQNNHGGQKQPINSLYTIDENGQAIVKKDHDGNPLVKDGDMALLDNDGNGKFGHCVRLNVDKNGVLTYSAGNTDRDHAPISKLGNSQAAVIPVQDHAQELAKKNYQEMPREKLLAEAQKRGLLALNGEDKEKANTAADKPHAELRGGRLNLANNDNSADKPHGRFCFSEQGKSNADTDKPHAELRGGRLNLANNDNSADKPHGSFGFSEQGKSNADTDKPRAELRGGNPLFANRDKDRKQLSEQLKRDHKYTLDGTLPMNIPQELREFANKAEKWFNQLFDSKSEERSAERRSSLAFSANKNEDTTEKRAQLYATRNSLFSR